MPANLIDPILQYDHDEGQATIGGFVYHGTKIPELDGKYTVFGKVLKGIDVVNRIQKGDVLKRAYLKDEGARP